ncbi:hypothetical protein ILYODFUR_018547 [Ilyodon furcidens]|uniref:Uncharacterized protein n=1 Tax=Ilyodon furcidens TaxID=33524 RepID=A0ABV0TWW5_9TELE
MESSPYGAVYLSPPPDNSWRSMLPWPSANHPASSSSPAPTRTLAKLSAGRTVTACAVEGLHPVIVDTEQVG